MRLEQDLTDGETGFIAFVAWHFSNGKRYRDFVPGSVPFRRLRDARIPADFSNTLEER